jgi:hypothetical protein
MAHDLGSIERRDPPSVAPTKFVDPMREDRLGCLRSTAWLVCFELVICIAAIAVWLSIRRSPFETKGGYYEDRGRDQLPPSGSTKGLLKQDRRTQRSLCLGRFVRLASKCCVRKPGTFGSSTAKCATRQMGD